MLWPHQQQTLKFLAKTPRAIDTSDPGTGKTVVEILDFAEEPKATRGRMLVVCPKTLMVPAWGEDIAKFAPNLTVAFAFADNRKAAFDTGADVVIINSDGVKWLDDKVNVNCLRGFTRLVIDEFTVFKHPGSQRTKSMMRLRKHFKVRRGLSGAPNPNSVMELWAPMMIIDDGKRLGDSFFKLRGSVQNSVQKGPSPNHREWFDRPGAAQAVHELLADITIRHAFEDVMTHVPPNHRDTKAFELSTKARKLYDKMETDCILAFEDKTVNAVHAAALRTKLLQIACLTGDTEVLSERGWKRIDEINPSDRVWDGIEWVTTRGALRVGSKQVVDCFSVRMTPDHKILTRSGWATATEALHANADGRFDRAPFRTSCSAENSGKEHTQEHFVVDAVRLWEAGYTDRVELEVPDSFHGTFVRMQPLSRIDRATQITRNDQPSAVQQVEQNHFPLLQRFRQGLQKLRRAWDHSVQTLAGLVQELCRRHGRGLSTGIIAGPQEQQPRVLKTELSVGNASTTRAQHTLQHAHPNPGWANDRSGSSSAVPAKAYYDLCASQARQHGLASTSAYEDVYDVVDAGPRHRFTVRGKDGVPFVVHNSGAVYDGGEDSSYQLVDSTRYELIADIVEDRAHSVVFFNWKHQRDLLQKEFASRKMTFALIDGSVDQRKRDAVVADYQDGKYQTILLHPKTGAHGLTLTRGDTTVFSSPIYEADLMKQGIARIYRGIQDKVTNTVFVEAKNTVEQAVYERLNGKYERMSDLLELMRARKK